MITVYYFRNIPIHHLSSAIANTVTRACIYRCYSISHSWLFVGFRKSQAKQFKAKEKLFLIPNIKDTYTHTKFI